jgi:hypothetical protein
LPALVIEQYDPADLARTGSCFADSCRRLETGPRMARDHAWLERRLSLYSADDECNAKFGVFSRHVACYYWP